MVLTTKVLRKIVKKMKAKQIKKINKEYYFLPIAYIKSSKLDKLN